MRIVYSTPRLENAERIADLLAADGIAVRLLYGPRHRRAAWRGTSYVQSGDAGQWPRVMVLNNGDLPQARARLREAGFLAPAAFEREDPDLGGTDAAAGAIDLPGRAPYRLTEPAPAAEPGRRLARRIRLGLVGLLLAVVVVQSLRYWLG